jgi:hypothetical protein
MRPHEGKEFGIWLDHSGNFLRFRDDWEELYSDGVKDLKEGGEKAKKELTEREKKEAKCPSCGVLWTFPDDKCGECGHVRVRMNTVVNVPGELLELQAANKRINIPPQQFYSELLYYARSKGIKEGWAYFKMKEKFGVMPRGLHTEGKEPTPETLNWIKSRNIAYAKARNK